VNKPIKFVGTGEKMVDVFYPIRMAERILGMEMLSLVERAQEQFDEEEAEEFKRKSPKRIWF
jgi:signal recognition particle subunit SRP54